MLRALSRAVGSCTPVRWEARYPVSEAAYALSLLSLLALDAGFFSLAALACFVRVWGGSWDLRGVCVWSEQPRVWKFHAQYAHLFSLFWLNVDFEGAQPTCRRDPCSPLSHQGCSAGRYWIFRVGHPEMQCFSGWGGTLWNSLRCGHPAGFSGSLLALSWSKSVDAHQQGKDGFPGETQFGPSALDSPFNGSLPKVPAIDAFS